MTVSERTNAATFLEHTTVRPFLFKYYYYKCLYCDEQYSDITSSIDHVTSHAPPTIEFILKNILPQGKKPLKVDISTLKCRICEQNHKNLEEIRNHLSAIHQIKFTKAGNGMIEYNLTPKDDGFVCHLCEKFFYTFTLLNRHMNVHYCNQICEICGAGFLNRQRLLQHKQIHEPGGHPCKECKKSYSTSSNLRIHVKRTHEYPKPTKTLKCSHCPERFSEHYTKMNHIKQVHKINFIFECETCNKKFSRRRALTVHVNKIHTQKFKCELCGKCYGIKSDLNMHMRSHRAERSFICTMCKRAYMHERSLAQHIKGHGDSFKYKCSKCEESFLNRNDFNKHMKRLQWVARYSKY